jgi:hypothetical protein
VCESWLYGAVCRQSAEPCVKDGYKELCVDRELNCE